MFGRFWRVGCLIASEFRTHEDILAPLSQRTIWEGLYESSRAVNNGWRFTARTKFRGIPREALRIRRISVEARAITSE